MRLLARVDGGARGNPGPAGWGLQLEDAEGRVLVRAWGYLGETTNNVAEYRALIAALQESIARGATELEVRTDSELIQRQVTGVYKVRQAHLAPLVAEVRALSARVATVRILHVPRAENREADALANRAMDERRSGRDEGPP